MFLMKQCNANVLFCCERVVSDFPDTPDANQSTAWKTYISSKVRKRKWFAWSSNSNDSFAMELVKHSSDPRRGKFSAAAALVVFPSSPLILPKDCDLDYSKLGPYKS